MYTCWSTKKRLKSLKAKLNQIPNKIKELEADRAKLKIKCDYEETTEQATTQNTFPAIIPKAINKAGRAVNAFGRAAAPVCESLKPIGDTLKVFEGLTGGSH